MLEKIIGLCVCGEICLINEPQRQKTYLRTCASSKDLDKPAHLGILIRLFTGHIMHTVNFLKFKHQSVRQNAINYANSADPDLTAPEGP